VTITLGIGPHSSCNYLFGYSRYIFLQCFDAVGWAAGRASGLCRQIIVAELLCNIVQYDYLLLTVNYLEDNWMTSSVFVCDKTRKLSRVTKGLRGRKDQVTGTF